MNKANRKLVIGVLSVGRTDYSYFKPILAEISKNRSLKYFLIVAGMHLSRKFGSTYKEIIKDGFRIDEKIAVTPSLDSSRAAARATGLMSLGLASILSRNALDALLVLGDRFETLGAVSGAIPFNIPIAHISGGDITEGLIDEEIRHAITKIAHIHFPTNELSRKRIIQMGEEEWRVFNAGSPSLDLMKSAKLYPKNDFFKMHGLDIDKKLFLITFHPVTLELENTKYYLDNLIKALRSLDANTIITYPNCDPCSGVIIEKFKKYVKESSNAKFVKNLGIKGYFSALKHSDVMIGNSSSGIIEAATFALPVVDIGNRQKNRLSGRNVIHSGYGTKDIVKSINRALSGPFRNSLKNIRNPYGEGDASKKIVKILNHILNKKSKKEIITKRFCLIE